MGVPRAISAEAKAALDAAAVAAEEHERLTFAARAAKVRRDILIRRARRQGAPYQQIADRVGFGRERSIKRICDGPEPDLYGWKPHQPRKRSA